MTAREANNAPDRHEKPTSRSRGRLVEATWGDAMSLVAGRAQEAIEKFTAISIGSHNTGQLFIEEDDTLAILGKAGLGTPHRDGNTRLCTATAARALIETIGADGQPGS